MFKRIRFWILDRVGKRDEQRTYLGHGDYDTERGWWVFGHWFSYDGAPKDN